LKVRILVGWGAKRETKKTNLEMNLVKKKVQNKEIW